MSLGQLVVAAVKVQGRIKSEVARDYRVSRGWVHELVRRYHAQGEAGLEPRSRRPHSSPHRTPVELEDEIVELRKHLSDQGLDAGAHTTGRSARISSASLSEALDMQRVVLPAQDLDAPESDEPEHNLKLRASAASRLGRSPS